MYEKKTALLTPEKKRFVYELTLPIEYLPSSFEGMRILHISDIHWGSRRWMPFLKKKEKDIDRNVFLKKLKTHLRENDIQPDVVFFTGDFLDDTPEKGLQKRNIDTMRSFFPEKPRYFVLGNHDYVNRKKRTNTPRETLVPILKDMGFIDMTNTHKTLQRGEDIIHLIGLDDCTQSTPVALGHNKKQTPYQNIIVHPHKTNLVITHNLDAISKPLCEGIDVVFSGHSHAGEVDLWFYDGYKKLKKEGSYKNIWNQKSWYTSVSSRTYSIVNPGLETTSPFGRFRSDLEGVCLVKLIKDKFKH